MWGWQNLYSQPVVWFAFYLLVFYHTLLKYLPRWGWKNLYSQPAVWFRHNCSHYSWGLPNGHNCFEHHLCLYLFGICTIICICICFVSVQSFVFVFVFVFVQLEILCWSERLGFIMVILIFSRQYNIANIPKFQIPINCHIFHVKWSKVKFSYISLGQHFGKSLLNRDMAPGIN